MLSRLVADPSCGAYRIPLAAAALHEVLPVTSTSVSIELSQRLNRGLKLIASAEGTEAVLLATVRAANDLANVAGIVAIPSDHTISAIVAVDDSVTMLSDNSSALRRSIVSAARADESIVQFQAPMGLELPSGRKLRIQKLLTLSLSDECGFTCLAFFWLNGADESDEHTSLLPGLAATSGLALRSQQGVVELNRLRTEQRAQLNEIQHRARNVLAVVRSIIRRSGQSAESPEEFTSHMEGRIGALARTQGALIIDGNLGPELEDLIRTELTANAVREAQLSIAGPPLRLVPRAAETIALTLHELTTNALKFGALTVPEGRIAVSWRIATAPSSTLHWSWIESNVRIAPSAQRRGFGRELIESVLPYELGAITRFTLEASGLRCEIDLPINERTSATDHGAYATGDRYVNQAD